MPEMVSRAPMRLARRSMGAEVVAQRPPLRHLLDDVWISHMVLRDDIIINEQFVVSARRLSVDQAVRLDRRFLRITLPFDDDALLAGPASGLLGGVSPQHIVI